MDSERFSLTRDGYEALKRELELLEARYKDQLANYGDVNYSAFDPTPAEASYVETKTEKEMTEERIGHLRFVLERAEVLEDDPDPQRVDPGDRVTVWDFATKQEQQFDLISGEEIINGRHGVSLDSPVGRALIGHHIGDVVEVDVPDGKTRYAIRKLERIA